MLVVAPTAAQRGGDAVFRDRADAGDRLAERLVGAVGDDPAVLAIPRGGVVVGARVAGALGVPLDVVVPRKLGAPGNPELGIGAVAPGVRVLHEDLIARLRVSDEELERETEAQQREVERRTLEYRGARPPLELRGRTVVLVDDGVATGGTVLAAAAWARAQGAARVILAVPILPASIVPRLLDAVDDVIFVAAPHLFGSVGEWYEDFRQVSDAEVKELLASG
jgi:putative phosphoribosyl transferase